MKKIKWLKRLVVLAVIVGLGLGATSAKAFPAATAEDYCIGSGGVWVGGPHNGTCYMYNSTCSIFPGGTGMYLAFHIYEDPPGVINIVLIDLCVPVKAGPGPNIDKVMGDPEGGTSSAKDWHVDYPAGACETPCRLNVGHTTNAADKAGLPGMVDSVYYKTDSADPYKICYDGGDANMLYQFVSGAWVPVPTTWYGDMLCTTATGPGAFAAVSE